MVEVVRSEFVPDPSLSREDMVELQREIGATARFEDDLPLDPRHVGEASDADAEPIVAGVDQAFTDDRAVSAIVALQGDTEVERSVAISPLEIPYLPGLLAFREGGPILDAFEQLSVEPALVLFDGSGRIHYRQAGLATHIGVMVDLPSVGVAKGLLCGRPRESTEDLPAGTRIPIESNDRVEAPEGTVLGYALQTRQFTSSRQHVNPVYVSPGHRVGAEAAADFVEATCAGLKLPEPIRRADRAATEAARDLQG